MICARGGCTAAGKPKYCSQRCSGIDIAHRRGSQAFRVIAAKAHASRRAHGYAVLLRPVDLHLLRAGRYGEAARILYDRGYTAGWIAAKTGRRQLPAARRSA